jgi:heme A synthase
MGRRTKGWIKGMRVVQLCLRVLESVAAVGIIVVMGLSGLIGWVMGVTVGLSDHLVSPY